ncbi:stabilization of membrane putative [Desmophyllum pertusum]|uniref:Stabilization of membrane putative n=1 Tax=Desmophyllum pertusum TaxID=174260 RepID=A0A9X0CLC3_9CNID|nr:stabilization of membrane putative [Desmophyllum pertusum]
MNKWSAQARSKLDSYEKDFVSESPNPAEGSLADSWLFACTIFTTIGYGNIVPVSMCGRIFCILYAFIGIPLFTVVASNLASLITGSRDYVPQNMHHTVCFGGYIIVGLVLVTMLFSGHGGKDFTAV